MPTFLLCRSSNPACGAVVLEKRGLRKLVAAGTVPAGNLPQTRLATPIHKTSEAAEQVAAPAELTNTQPAPGT